MRLGEAGPSGSPNLARKAAGCNHSPARPGDPNLGEGGFLTQRRKGAKPQRVFAALASWRLGDFALKCLVIREILLSVVQWRMKEFFQKGLDKN
jgi:hypothetical protein